MIRGTTPMLEFALPFDTSLIAEMYITITQNGVTMLEKTLSDCNCSGTLVSLTLTQEDTLKLEQKPNSDGEMQIRVDEHNHVVERTYSIERELSIQKEQIKVANHRIEDLDGIEHEH